MSAAVCFFFSSRRRHTRLQGDWSSDVCSSDLPGPHSPCHLQGPLFPFFDAPLPACSGHPALAQGRSMVLHQQLAATQPFQHVLTGVPLAKEELIEMQGRVDVVLPDSSRSEEHTSEL